MLGDGHLVYGPKQPGSFLAISVLMMEDDSALRRLGMTLEEIVQSKAVDAGAKVVLAANPGAQAVVTIVRSVMDLVAGILKENKDDELFRTDGVFLRDVDNPYHINRLFRRANDFVDVDLKVIPLSTANGQGAVTNTLTL